MKAHLSAIKDHLSGIDPKLVKAAVASTPAPASKEGLAALLRESKRLLERKGMTARESAELLQVW